MGRTSTPKSRAYNDSTTSATKINALTLMKVRFKLMDARTKSWHHEKNKPRQRPTLPYPCGYSTIGPGGLNYRVRNGIGCGPTGKTTGKFVRLRIARCYGGSAIARFASGGG